MNGHLQMLLALLHGLTAVTTMGVNGYRITDEAMLLKNDLDLILARDPQSAAQIDQVLELALMPKPVAGR